MARIGGVLVVIVLALLAPALSYSQTAVAVPASAPELSVDQIKDFLKTARVIRTRSTAKGVTAPKRVSQ